MNILQHPNKILRQKSVAVSIKDITKPRTKNIIQKMKAVLINSIKEGKGGVALAAPQIGYNLRIFIVLEDLMKIKKDAPSERTIIFKESAEQKPTFINISEDKLKFLVFINPKIIKKSRKKMLFQEGCLSMDGVFGKIKRPEKLTVKATDENGKKFQFSATKIMAEAIEHEIDHLDGILFIDKTLSTLPR